MTSPSLGVRVSVSPADTTEVIAGNETLSPTDLSSSSAEFLLHSPKRMEEKTGAHQSHSRSSRFMIEDILGSSSSRQPASFKVVDFLVSSAEDEQKQRSGSLPTPLDLRKRCVKDERQQLVPIGTSSSASSSSSLPAWIFCTRYSDRPTAGPRQRRPKRNDDGATASKSKLSTSLKKRPRTAFSQEQLSQLESEFRRNRYLTETRRSRMAQDLGLKPNQVKIWFQNKRAKLKKTSGEAGELAKQLMAQGLYRHSEKSRDGLS